MDLNTLIRDVENFPKEGILFKDITPLLQDAKGLQESIDKMAESVQDVDFDIVIGPESRGFIFGVPLAYKLQKASFLLENQVNYLMKQLAKATI